MDGLGITFFLVSVLVGSYFQSVTGFAMGMIIIAVMGVAQIDSLITVTAVISLLSLINAVLAVRGQLHALQRRMFFWLAVGQVSAIWAGVWLLGYLDSTSIALLQMVLAVFITAGALSMLVRPQPRDTLSGSAGSCVAGAIGGLSGGMFAASGPVLGWFAYRQPLSVASIRTTLLCCFMVTTSVRTIVVGLDGGLTGDVWLLFALGLPIVVAGTWLGRNYAPAWSDEKLKRLSFAFLLGAGLWLGASALFG